MSHAFFISKARLKVAKNKQKPSNTLRLNFCNLKNIYILHPHYRPKIIGLTLKIKQEKQACLNSWDYTINHDENGEEKEKIGHIDSP